MKTNTKALRRWLPVALLGAGLSSSPEAQGHHARIWPGDCSTEVVLSNQTGGRLGALWIGLGADGLAALEIAEIHVHDLAGGRDWDVDDNEDLDNDDPGESDAIDSTPRGEPTGWHRVQARTDADSFAPGESFRVRLCGEGASSLRWKPILIRPVLESEPAVGGDGGTVGFASTLVLDAANGTGELTLVESSMPPIGALDFSFPLRNDTASALPGVVITAPQAGTDVIDVVSNGGGSYHAPSGLYFFPTPLQPSQVAAIELSLDMLHGSGSTVVAVELLAPTPVPAMGPWFVVLLVVGSVAAGIVCLGQRRA